LGAPLLLQVRELIKDISFRNKAERKRLALENAWRKAQIRGEAAAIASRSLQRQMGVTRDTTNRITIDPARMGGQPCIRDLRLTVRGVLEALAVYPDHKELKREYPELEDEDIQQALKFAAAELGHGCDR
jgi:uncharacterized protein (DUF433 family)